MTNQTLHTSYRLTTASCWGTHRAAVVHKQYLALTTSHNWFKPIPHKYKTPEAQKDAKTEHKVCQVHGLKIETVLRRQKADVKITT